MTSKLGRYEVAKVGYFVLLFSEGSLARNTRKGEGNAEWVGNTGKGWETKVEYKYVLSLSAAAVS